MNGVNKGSKESKDRREVFLLYRPFTPLVGNKNVTNNQGQVPNTLVVEQLRTEICSTAWQLDIGW